MGDYLSGIPSYFVKSSNKALFCGIVIVLGSVSFGSEYLKEKDFLFFNFSPSLFSFLYLCPKSAWSLLGLLEIFADTLNEKVAFS